MDKLDILLLGIKTRYNKNKDYFISIAIDEKIMDTDIETTLNNFKISDKENLIYRERGATLTIKRSAKGASMTQTDETNEPSNANERKYLINKNNAPELLRAIGILTKDYKIKNDMIRKYNQIDHFVELVAPMFDGHQNGDTITILDCGCGKSYLSFVLNFYLRDILKKSVKIIGVDYSEGVIKTSKAMAQSLAYHNMEFICADLNTFTPPKNITAVISLHACDTATDLAIASAVLCNSQYIICSPCCHKELIEQIDIPLLAPITKHGILKARLSDLITDGMRALKLESLGYNTKIIEYVSPIDTPKNLLILASKSKNKKSSNQYDTLRQELSTTSKLDVLLGDI